MSRLIIIGASGHGKVIADIAARCGYTDIAFLDDNPNIRECMGYPVIGKVKGAKEYPGAKFIVAIGNPEIRQKIQEQLEQFNADFEKYESGIYMEFNNSEWKKLSIQDAYTLGSSFEDTFNAYFGK